jgi:hypothetical protein
MIETVQTPRIVRCISLWQPWASLMACGAKHLETRLWDTKVRGEIFIHAAQTKKGLLEAMRGPHFLEIGHALGVALADWEEELPFGAIIARGELATTATAEKGLEIFPDQKPFGDFTPGRFVHRYHNLTRIKPIPWKGSQRFFFAELPPIEFTHAD